jgi:menaquinone-dependent protoporphyrinogen IX oxidase
MGGAIYFSGQYGSTAQYAKWIGEATGLPVFDLRSRSPNPSEYDFLILGSSVIVFKMTIRKWVEKNLLVLMSKPVILFTVSGAGPGPKLDGWINECLHERFVSHAKHVGLRGRMDPEAMSWRHRMIQIIGAWKNKDPIAKKEELEGFDFMDKSSIEPIVEWIKELAAADAT